MSEIVYRYAQVGDISAIVAFQLAMALETEQVTLDPATCLKGVTAVFEVPSHGRYFVAENGAGEVVASLLITYEWSDWRNGLVWWIQSVYVTPAERGKGVFAGLYGHIKQQADADQNVRGLRLYADRRNTGAQQVYTRLGMDGGHYVVFEAMK